MRQNTPFENAILIFIIISILSFIIAALCVFVFEKNMPKQIAGRFFLYLGAITGIIALFLLNFAPL